MTQTLLRNAPEPPRDMIDCHVHVGPSDSTELYYPRLSGEEYLRLAEESNVSLACAFPPLRTSYLDANTSLRDWAATTGGRIRAFARLGGPDLPLTIPAVWMLRRKLNYRLRGRPSDLHHPDELRTFAGVKLLPHMDGVPRGEELEVIDELRMPVVVHGGVHVPPAWIEKNLVPRLRGPVIVAHLGSFPCDERLVREAVDLARRRDNVYLDTSGVWLADFLRFAADNVLDKLMFASDAPLTHPRVAWAHLAGAVHDDEMLLRIVRDTPRRVLQVPS